MHLAMISPYPPTLTGISQYGYYVSRALVQTRAFERISVLSNAPICQVKGDFARPVYLEHAWQPQSLGTAWRILERLRNLSPDVVWLNLGASIFGSSGLANLAGFLIPGLVRAAGFPTVVTLHELIELADLAALSVPGGRLARFGASLLTRLASQADVVCLTLCEYEQWFQSHYPAPRTAHIPIGAYQSPELLPETGPGYLLFFTSLAPYKGLELLLEAYRSLRQRYPQLDLVIAGAAHPRFPDYTKTLQRKFGELPGVRWLGAVQPAEVRNLFAGAKIVILPYTASTGSSSVLIQTVMWGRPAVISDLTGNRSSVEESGLEVNFFKSGEVPGLIQAIRRLLENPVLRRQQVMNNLKAVWKMSPDQTARRYVNAFNLAIQTHCPETEAPNREDETSYPGDKSPGFGLGR